MSNVARGEAALVRFTHSQRGLFTVAQARAVGISDTTRRRRVAARAYEEIAPGVLRLAATKPLDWLDRLAAEGLATGAIAAGWSAAALFGLADPPRLPELIVPRRRRNLDRASVRSTTQLPASDIVRIRGLRATSPMRTTILCADRLDVAGSATLISKAATRHLLRVTWLERRAAELVNPARPGARRVLDAIELLHPDLERARNDWEASMLDLARRYGLANPEVNYRIVVDSQVRFLDLAWPLAKVFAEFDGYLPHVETREIFDDERKRQNALVDAGWLPFRVTSTTLRDEPGKEFGRIARAIRRRSSAAPETPLSHQNATSGGAVGQRAL